MRIMYLSYEEYEKLGGNVTESAFPNLERKAERLIDYYTQNRIKELTIIPEEVKEVLTSFIDIYDKEQSGEKVASFSNDGVSVSFDNSKTSEQMMYDLAVEYLPMELINCEVV